MAMNLNQSKVTLDDPKFDTMLKNMQANILKGHGRDFANHLFFSFKPQSINEAKSWIKNFSGTLTSAKCQLEKSRLFNQGLIEDGGTIITLSLSVNGYKSLGFNDAEIPKGSEQTFGNGMKHNPGEIGDDLTLWDEGFTKEIDLLLIIADDNPERLDVTITNIISDTAGFLTLCANQRGVVLKMANGIGIEHFGYADGISQPLYLKDEIEEQCSMKEWQDKTDLIRLLAEDSGGEDCFGSFLVFRKLEQNVLKFKDQEHTIEAVLTVLGKPNEELAGAMLVGRFESGKPTVQSSTGFIPNPPRISNDFDYSKDLDGNKCPFHAHTRLMNPRKGDQIAGDVSSVRITRRGIPYDDKGRFTPEESFSLTQELLDRELPEDNLGLLFLCYQSSIDTQFLIMQKFWANQGIIKNHDHKTHDSIIAQIGDPVPDKTFPVKWGESAQGAAFSFPVCVTNKGGEYFFTPSLPFLQQLHSDVQQV